MMEDVPDPTPDVDTDLLESVEPVDPADEAARIQEGLEEGLQEGRPEARDQLKLQKALRSTLDTVDMLASMVSEELEAEPEELDNMTVLWSNYLKDKPEVIGRILEQAPLITAGAGTLMIYAPKIKRAADKGDLTLSSAQPNAE